MSEKKEYEVAVETFQAAEAAYTERQEYLESGRFMADLVAMCGNDIERMQEQFKVLWGQLRTLLANRNTALKTAQSCLRQAVQLAPNQWRGPEGKSSGLTHGSFTVNSVTSRGFDPPSLFSLMQKRGLLERLYELEGTDKDGKRYKLVKQEWDIDFEELLKWLKANQLTEVIEGAYDEKEKTPMVKGPKELGFLGEKKGS